MQKNWFGLLDNTIANQIVEDNQTNEVVQQDVTTKIEFGKNYEEHQYTSLGDQVYT